MINLFEKLINEHGSSTILKERLTILKEEYAAIEKQKADLYAENQALKSKVGELESKINKISGNTSNHACDHCGSSNIVRSGNKPDKRFGKYGVKHHIFKFSDCGKSSSFMQDLK